MPLIEALGRQKQAEVYKFEASVVYAVNIVRTCQSKTKQSKQETLDDNI